MNKICSFVICIKAEYIFIDIPQDVETRFDTWYYELERLYQDEKIKMLLDWWKMN